jgi:hypothetical protein
MTSKFSFVALTGVLLALGAPAFAADMAPSTPAPNPSVSTDSKAKVNTPITNDKAAIGTTTTAKPDASVGAKSDSKLGTSAAKPDASVGATTGAKPDSTVGSSTGKLDSKSGADLKVQKDKQSKTHKAPLQSAQHSPEAAKSPIAPATSTVQH